MPVSEPVNKVTVHCPIEPSLVVGVSYEPQRAGVSFTPELDTVKNCNKSGILVGKILFFIYLLVKFLLYVIYLLIFGLSYFTTFIIFEYLEDMFPLSSENYDWLTMQTL